MSIGENLGQVYSSIKQAAVEPGLGFLQQSLM